LASTPDIESKPEKASSPAAINIAAIKAFLLEKVFVFFLNFIDTLLFAIDCYF